MPQEDSPSHTKSVTFKEDITSNAQFFIDRRAGAGVTTRPEAPTDTDGRLVEETITGRSCTS